MQCFRIIVFDWLSDHAVDYFKMFIMCKSIGNLKIVMTFYKSAQAILVVPPSKVFLCKLSH